MDQRRVRHDLKCNHSRSLFLSHSTPNISSLHMAAWVIFFKGMSDHVYLDKPLAPASSQWHPTFTEYQSTLQRSVWPHIIWLLVTSLTSFTILTLNTPPPPTLSSWLFLQHSKYTPIVEALHLLLPLGIFFPQAALQLLYPLQAKDSNFPALI